MSYHVIVSCHIIYIISYISCHHIIYHRIVFYIIYIVYNIYISIIYIIVSYLISYHMSHIMSYIIIYHIIYHIMSNVISYKMMEEDAECVGLVGRPLDLPDVVLTPSLQFGVQIHEPRRQSALFLARCRFIVDRFSYLFAGRIAMWTANKKRGLIYHVVGSVCVRY
jgi:hypothetical protein